MQVLSLPLCTPFIIKEKTPWVSTCAAILIDSVKTRNSETFFGENLTQLNQSYVVSYSFKTENLLAKLNTDYSTAIYMISHNTIGKELSPNLVSDIKQILEN